MLPKQGTECGAQVAAHQPNVSQSSEPIAWHQEYTRPLQTYLWGFSNANKAEKPITPSLALLIVAR